MSRWKDNGSLGVWHCDEKERVMSLQNILNGHRRTVSEFIHRKKHLPMPYQRK